MEDCFGMSKEILKDVFVDTGTSQVFYFYMTFLVVLIHQNEVFFRESEALTAEWNLLENYLLKPAGII